MLAQAMSIVRRGIEAPTSIGKRRLQQIAGFSVRHGPEQVTERRPAKSEANAARHRRENHGRI
jgi:hypothetical protein